MALINCPECQREISTEATQCPHCGAKKKSPPSYWWAVFIGLTIVFGALAIAGSRGSEERSNERGAIDLCWKDYERKSFDPETKRFIAGTCEMMERKFTEKHGVKP